MDAMLDGHIQFVLIRHEQDAASMADVYGRLTGHALALSPNLLMEI